VQVILIVAIASMLLIAESSPARPIDGGTAGRLLLAVIAMAVAPLFAAATSSLVSRQLRTRGSDAGQWLRRYRKLRKVHLVLWLAAGAGIAYGLGWPRIVRFNWRLDRVPLVDDLLVLAPILVPLVLSWAAFYRADRDASGGTFISRRQYIGLHLRHYLGILLVPVMALLLIQDVVEWCAPAWLRGEAAALVLIAATGLLLAVFPFLLRRVWRTRPLPAGPLRDRLELISRASEWSFRDILVWETNSMVVNAAVTGLNPWSRYVFLSDGLLQLLSEDEIVAVFGHELGHVRNRHIWLRAAAMLIPLSVGWFLYHAMPDAVAQAESFVERAGFDASTWFGPLALVAIVGYVLTFFAAYSRSLEHEADLAVSDAFPPGMGVPILCSALDRLAEAHGNRGTKTWQHASIADRIKFLESVRHEPKRGLRYRRRIRLIGGIVIGLAFGPLICLLLCSFLSG
jgi:STE24 endopeptidase